MSFAPRNRRWAWMEKKNSNELRILFWNCGKNDLTSILQSCVIDLNIDLIVLAEFEKIDLNQIYSKKAFLHNVNQWIAVSSRISKRFVKPIVDGSRYSVFKIKLPGMKKYIVSGIHLRSKLYANIDLQATYLGQYIRSIIRAEEKEKCNNTILLGDFNLEPYENPMLNFSHMNSIYSRDMCQSLGHKRKVGEEERGFFFNPMWAFIGDLSDGPSGTYFSKNPGSSSNYWKMLDQILIRSHMSSDINRSNVSILTSLGGQNLLDNYGRPNHIYSDHLPVLFSFSMEVEDAGK